MRALLTALVAATALSACASGCAVDNIQTSSVERAGSAVRIETTSGLGSGVYIGNGLVITAAHVVGDLTTVQLRSDVGDIQQGEVLWSNKAYDIATIRPANRRRFTAAHLACRHVKAGEAITAEGNPFGLRFITMHGYIAAAPTAYEPKWKSAFVTDISMASGMSGGPAYAENGDVIGINVGVVDPHGGATGATSGFAFVVPSSAVCGLLGRL